MNKRNRIFLVLLILAIFGIYFYYSGVFGDIFKLENPQHCSITPNDFKCVCGDNEVKQGGLPWVCNELPPAPTEVTFPIETWEEARAYAESLLGSFECKGEYQYDGLLSGEVNKQCSQYGDVIKDSKNLYLGHLLQVECRSIDTVDEFGVPKSGQMVFVVRFDPNDGWVYELACNDNLIQCPEITFMFGENMKENPQPTCGDFTINDKVGFCCNYGESFENCPSDCQPIAEPVCGDNICESGENGVNKCFTDCYINYIPTDYITKKSELLAFIYGWQGSLLELNSTLGQSCVNVINKPDEIVNVKWVSNLEDESNILFRCATTIRRPDGGNTYSSFFYLNIDWKNKIAPATVPSSYFYGGVKFPI